MTTALTTGVASQDGSFLAELVLAKGYEVHVMIRRTELTDPVDRPTNGRAAAPSGDER